MTRLRLGENRSKLINRLEDLCPMSFQGLLDVPAKDRGVVDIVNVLMVVKDPVSSLARAIDDLPDLFPPRESAVLTLRDFLRTYRSATPGQVRTELSQFDSVEVTRDELRVIYEHTDSEEYVGHTGPDARDMTVGRLAALLHGHHRDRAMCAFLARVAHRLRDVHGHEGPAGHIEQWIGRNLARFGVEAQDHETDRRRIETEPWGARMHVLCHITPSRRLRRSTPEHYDVAMFEYVDPRSDGRPPTVSDIEPFDKAERKPLDTLSEMIGRTIAARLAPFPDVTEPVKRAVLEFMLPVDQIELSVERWQAGTTGYLGTLLPVVVRPLDDERGGDRGSWLKKWQHAMQPHARAQRIDTTVAGDFEQPACIVLAGSPGELSKQLELAIAARVPWVLWDRRSDPVNGLAEHPPADVPDQLRNRRRLSGETVDQAVLIWDNPYWVPCDGRLVWKGPEEA